MEVVFKTSTITYSVTGSGPTVVWLHGFLESKTIWSPLISCLDSKFTNVCIDLLGHGNTKSISDVHSMELQAEAVTTVIKALNVKSLSVIGHSMGGYVGLALLRKLNLQITHFVLLNSTSYSDTLEKKLNRDRAIKLIATQKQNFVRMGIVNLFSESSRNTYAEVIESLILTAQKTTSRGIVAALVGMRDRKPSTEVLKNFDGEKLIISGKKDPVISLSQSILEAEETKTQLLSLSGGHMSYLEAFSELKLKLEFFLNT